MEEEPAPKRKNIGSTHSKMVGRKSRTVMMFVQQSDFGLRWGLHPLGSAVQKRWIHPVGQICQLHPPEFVMTCGVPCYPNRINHLLDIAKMTIHMSKIPNSVVFQRQHVAKGQEGIGTVYITHTGPIMVHFSESPKNPKSDNSKQQ